jgi:type IV pilus assembly protein PilW
MTDRIHARRQSGVTLIELMVAMVLGLLVAAGIVTIFTSTSSSNRAQTQLARLQEQGRFAVTQLKADLSMTNGMYCSNSGGSATQNASKTYIDGLRVPTVYTKETVAPLAGALADLTTPWASPYPAAAPTTPYSLPSFMMMRGYDCTISTCTPADPNTLVPGIPKQGTAVGSRVVGTDVLTLRYVNPARGWSIYPTGSAVGSTLTANTDSSLNQITLAPAAGEPPATDFVTGDLAMLADCSTGQIFSVNKVGTSLVPNAAGNLVVPNALQPMSAPKLFDLNRDFQTVTYFLQVADNGNGKTTGALMRRVNGGADSAATISHGGTVTEVVRGIERLDFQYGVEYPDGTIHFLTAAAVDASTKTTPGCTATVPFPADPVNDRGCLWRAVKSIEVDVLMDGQFALYTLTANEMQYVYSADGNTAPAAPDSVRIAKPVDQGFVNQMLRREFSALVSVRNYNP